MWPAVGIAGAQAHLLSRSTKMLSRAIRDLGMPRRLRDVNVVEAYLPRLAQQCVLDDWTYPNPRPITSPDAVMQILRPACWLGEPGALAKAAHRTA